VTRLFPNYFGKYLVQCHDAASVRFFPSIIGPIHVITPKGIVIESPVLAKYMIVTNRLADRWSKLYSTLSKSRYLTLLYG